LNSGRKVATFGSAAGVAIALVAVGFLNVMGIASSATPPDQQISLLDGSTIINIVKIPNVPANIKSLNNLRTIDSQTVARHSPLGNILVQADHRSQVALEANKGIPSTAGIHPVMQANYVVKITQDFARDLVNDPSLGFTQLGTPTNYDKKIYGTQIMVGDSIYLIAVFGL